MEYEQSEPAKLACEQRSWSRVRGLESMDRSVAFFSGLHDSLGKYSILRLIDEDIANLIHLFSEERSTEYTETKPPSPGCSLYGFMFDIKGMNTTGILVTALQIFSSESAGAAYDVFAATGSWRNKDQRHSPWSKKKPAGSWYHVAKRVPAFDHDSVPNTWYQPVRLNLEIPVYVPPGGVASLYIHSADAWGAVAYRMLDDTGCQASPGVETHRHRHVSFLTGTFTESSEPFEDVDGFVCAFAGAMEYDVVQTGTFCGPWAGLTMSEQGEHWSVDQQTPIFVS